MEEKEVGNRQASGEISLKEIITKIGTFYRYLLSKWVTVLIFGFIGAGSGFLYAQSKQPVYKAELSFALEDENSSGGGVGGALGLASQLGIDVGAGGGGGAFSGDNLLSLMKSRSMVEKTLLTTVLIDKKPITLAEFYISFNHLRDKWEKDNLGNLHFLPGADPSKFSRQQDSVLGVFHHDLITKNLTVDKADKKLSIIAIQVTSGNELFSKFFVEILAKNTSNFYVETKTKKSVQNLAILQYQTDSVRRALNNAISGVASSIDVNPNANASRQILRAPSQRHQVDVQANQAILTQLVANLEISKVSLRKDAPLIQIIDAPIMPLEVVAVGKIKSIVIGGVLASFLTILFFLFKIVIKDITA